MAWRLFGAEPPSKPMMGYCQLDPSDQTSLQFLSKFELFHSRKCIWKCRLPKWRPFCPGYRDDEPIDIIQNGRWYLQKSTLGPYSLSGKTSYRKISWSLEAARFGFNLFQSLWNLAGTWAALLPRCLSNFRAIRPLQHPISRLRDFTRFGGKTSYRLVNRGPEVNGNQT